MSNPQQARRKIGLYFGTFNPIHMGHLVIANHMATHTDLDEVWLVVTPLNPQKDSVELMAQEHRLQMVHLATAENELLQGSDVEFALPSPNYTAATMRFIRGSIRKLISASSLVKTTFTICIPGKTIGNWKHTIEFWSIRDEVLGSNSSLRAYEKAIRIESLSTTRMLFGATLR